MNVNPCTPMARRRDPGTDGHTIMDSSATIWVPRPSIPTPYCPASTAGPKELTYYGGRIPALSPQPSEGHGGVRRVQQPPDVMATRNIPPLVKSHNQRSRSQKGQSRGAVREGNKSAQKNCRQNGNFASGEGDGPDSQRGRRREELQTAGGNSACQTALSVPTRRSPLDHSFGQSECSPVVPAGSKSSASQAVHIAHRPDPSFGKEHCSPKLRSLTPCPAPHPAHLKPQATSKGKCFTDAHIHEFIMKRLAQIMAAQNQSRGCEGAERTHCLSSSNLNVCLPSKQNTGSLHLKRDESAPRQFTSTASSEEVGLSSAGNAGSSALDCNGNEQLSTVFGKGIPKEHAELTRDVEKQDGHANPTPENDSTEYPQIMKLAAAVCAKNEDENPVILSAVSGITSKEFLERRSASKVGTSGTREEYTSSWLNASSLDDLDKEPGGLHPISCVCHPETLETGTPISAENWQAEKTNKEMAEERTKMDTADSIQKSVLAVKGAPKSQKYEDISDDDIKNETSPSSKYSSCLPTSPKKRISHYGRSTDKTNDSVHQNPSLLTQTPSRSSKGQSSSSKILKSSQFGRRKDAKEGTFSDSSRSAKVSARQQVRKDWKDSYVSTRIERRHSSGPEDARRHASTSSQNASVPEPHDAGNGAELEPCPNVAKQKSPASATPLMRRTMTQAKRLTRAAHPRGGPDERNPAESRRPRSSSPSEVELLSQW
ncbi:unnamed protein product [Lota lota]